MGEKFYPYVVFLPAKQKHKVLSAIFGSKAAVDILKFSVSRGIQKKIYQKDLVEKLPYSNKTVIEHLKSLTEFGIFEEDMQKMESEGRTVWVKYFQLSDVGKWFALLLTEERDLTEKEKAEILQTIFRAYIKWIKNISEKLHMNKGALEKIFKEEMKWTNA